MEPQNTAHLDMTSLEAKFQNLSLATLGEGPHHNILNRAIRNVLSSKISEITLAQIFDGLPLSEVETDTYYGSSLCGDHPLHDRHIQLCPGVLEKTSELYSDFNIDSLQISSKPLLEYKGSAPGSRIFNTRLIELVAISIHQIAVQLYNLDTSLHKDDGIATWEPPKDHIIFWIVNPNGAPPTLFQHRQYRYYEQYPNGIADGVGYWAESRIFGGVVLFDRREPGSADDVDPESIYLHPERKNMTYRIYRLLDTQKADLLQFLLSDPSSSSSSSPVTSPLPIIGDEKNDQRVDPEESVVDTGIFRDVWERKPLGEGELDRRLKDVIDLIDFPTEDDLRRAQDRGRIMREKRLGYLDE